MSALAALDNGKTKFYRKCERPLSEAVILGFGVDTIVIQMCIKNRLKISANKGIVEAGDINKIFCTLCAQSFADDWERLPSIAS